MPRGIQDGSAYVDLIETHDMRRLCCKRVSGLGLLPYMVILLIMYVLLQFIETMVSADVVLSISMYRCCSCSCFPGGHIECICLFMCSSCLMAVKC